MNWFKSPAGIVAAVLPPTAELDIVRAAEALPYVQQPRSSGAIGACGVEHTEICANAQFARIRVDTFPKPTAAIKAEVARRITAWCRAEGVERAPKLIRSTIKEEVLRETFNPNALPVPKTQDIAVITQPTRTLVLRETVNGPAHQPLLVARKQLIEHPLTLTPSAPTGTSRAHVKRLVRGAYFRSEWEEGKYLATLCTLKVGYGGEHRITVEEDIESVYDLIRKSKWDKPITGKIEVTRDGGAPLYTFRYDFLTQQVGRVSWGREYEALDPQTQTELDVARLGEFVDHLTHIYRALDSEDNADDA